MSIPEVSSRDRLLAFLQEYYQGPGAIVGYRRYTSAATSTSTATATMDYVDGAGDKVFLSFVAPPSGVVELVASVFLNPGATNYAMFGLSDNGTTWSTYTPIGDPTDTSYYVFLSDAQDLLYMTARWVLPGLTPGQSYTFYLGFSRPSGSLTVYWGGNYGPLVLKATALPNDTVLTTS
tara:strand:+ start:4241 stop:4774 length:534 start_codon:yes stop_codon:yes gene_type:complete